MFATLAVVLTLAGAGLPAGFEASAGFSTLITQHVFSFALEPALEVGAGYRVREGWVLGLGARVGLGPVLPEGYVRLSAAPPLGRWAPSVGLELGLSARTEFPAGDPLLRETRKANEDGIGVGYVAACAQPLAFRWPRWRVSVLEVHVGTHLPDPGRTLRLQLGLLTVGWTP